MSMEFGEAASKIHMIREGVGRVIVGKEDVVDALLVAFIAEGHVLLEGVSGIGKTLLARSFAQAIGGKFKRIQMTPDLLPADIVGTNVYNPKDGSFSLRRGPIFANVILADELNRATPKVQAAFIEAMQERQVTIEGNTLPLERPFMVIATQMPYGTAGTFPLTEVQMDRFAYRIDVGYPTEDEEVEVVSRIDLIEWLNVDPVMISDEMIELVELAKSIYVHERVKRYIVNMVSKVRGSPYVRSGPSPRASIWLFKGSRVRALLEDREYVIPDDVKALASHVIPHRVQLKPEAEAEEVSVKKLIEETLKETPVPKGLEPKNR